MKACTETIDGKLPTASKAPRDASTWRMRKQETIDHLGAPDVPEPVLRVKAADALANARSIVADLRRTGPEVWQRFHAGAVDQLWYYRSLTVILSARHPGVLSDELRAAVTEMEQLSRLVVRRRRPAAGSGLTLRSCRRSRRDRGGHVRAGRTPTPRPRGRRGCSALTCGRVPSVGRVGGVTPRSARH